MAWILLVFFKGCQPLINCFRLYRGEDKMTAIQDNDGTGAAAFGHIDKLLFLPGLILELSDRRGSGINHGQNPADLDGITKTDIDKSVIHF